MLYGSNKHFHVSYPPRLIMEAGEGMSVAIQFYFQGADRLLDVDLV